MHLERVQQEQDEEEDKSDEKDNDETNEEEEEAKTMSSPKVWYFKLQQWIDHVRDVSTALIWILGTYLSLNKMMMRFCGCFLETHRMKNKPIKEGNKFFCLPMFAGYTVNYMPDRRTAVKLETPEYKYHNEFCKIESTILHVLSIIKN
eukprot:4975445-Ditylum_brightwellii.AAC.1